MVIDPISASLAGAQFGFSALGSFNERNQQQDQIRQANKQTQLNNQFQLQNWQYGEQMRQRQNRQARAIYDMKKQNYQLQKELDYDAYKEFYEDSQLKFNNLVRDAKLKTFQSATKLAEYQSKSMASALSRGGTGRSAGRGAANAAIKQGMMQSSITDKLVFAEQQMEKGIERNARRTDLRIKQAFNAIGPAPEDLPMAPMPVMGQMQSMPSDMGLITNLGGAALGSISTYNSLAAPSTGLPKKEWGGIPYALP